MRVYELAKEFNMKSVDLVDKARKTWRLPIRSYMEVLTKELENELRNKLHSEQKGKKESVERKIIKKILRKAPSKKLDQKKPILGVIRRKAEDIKLAQDQKLKESPPPVEEVKAPPAPVKEEPRPLDLEMEESFREEARKKFKKISEKEQVFQKFQASDFRKREVIFQPKKKRSPQDRVAKKTKITKPKSHKRVIKFFGSLSVKNLSQQMGVKLSTLLDKLKSEGLESHEGALLDFDIVSLIASEFGFEVKNREKTFDQLVQELKFGDLKAEPVSCPPVVTVMGHVDHGKTTLLDRLRRTRIADKEAGGITQHIGAYSVPVGSSFITFVDTPGHEAFSSMRARGARLTNIVVIVVSADDGVQSQTIEAIKHAQSAKAPILVAVNKIDKSGADLEKVKKQMSEHNLLPEDWGGDTIFVPVSALKGDGMKELLDQILLVAEMQEIKANPKQSAQGVVIESKMVKGRGWVVTLIVQNGTLKKFQYIMTPSLLGRVRQMLDDQGKTVVEILPGHPVEISGFDSAPQAGDLFYAVKDDKLAREFLSRRKQVQDLSQNLDKKSKEELLKIHTKKTKELNLVIKADVAGSLEAIKSSLSKIGSDEVQLNIIHSGLGGITESDVLLAATAGGEVIGFNIRPDSKSEKTAKEHDVPIWTYTVIYELIEQATKRAIGILDPDIVDEVCGKAEVREIFSVSTGAIAGSYVLSGKINRQHLARLIRDGRIIHEGKIKSLRRFKEDVKEVSEKYECGIGLEQYNDLKSGDIIETYYKKEVARKKL